MGEQTLSCVGLESVIQCRLSAGTPLFLRGVFSLWTERLLPLLQPAFSVKAERKPKRRVGWGLRTIFPSKQSWIKAFAFLKTRLLFTSAMTCSLLTGQTGGVKYGHISAGLRASAVSHALYSARGSGLCSFVAAV